MNYVVEMYHVGDKVILLSDNLECIVTSKYWSTTFWVYEVSNPKWTYVLEVYDEDISPKPRMNV